MFFINGVDGYSYLVKRDSIRYVKGNGDKSFFYVNEMEKPIIVSKSITEIYFQLNDSESLFRIPVSIERLSNIGCE